MRSDKAETEPAEIKLADPGRGLNIKYLVGSILAFFTLVLTLLCLGKQIFAFKTEKKKYE